MDEIVRDEWKRFLDPDVLRPNLITASLYIAAFEILKNTIVDQIKEFYTVGFDKSIAKDGGWMVDPNYQTRVLSRNRSPIYASLDWLKESKAINDEDIAAFERAKDFRNKIAHELAQMLSSGLPAELPDRFREVLSLVDKIGRWWVVNVEIPTNPDFSGEEVDESGIVPGPTMSLRLLIDIALGSESESKFYLNEFSKRTTKSK